VGIVWPVEACPERLGAQILRAVVGVVAADGQSRNAHPGLALLQTVAGHRVVAFSMFGAPQGSRAPVLVDIGVLGITHGSEIVVAPLMERSWGKALVSRLVAGVVGARHPVVA
jgi:hypothetical protein